jgi:hypothetical protein
MIRSDNWKWLSMQKSPELSAKLVFKDLHSEVRNCHDVSQDNRLFSIGDSPSSIRAVQGPA